MTPSTTTAPVEKPRLSFWHIWNMNFGFLGIQFGFALQNANTSRIFETLGASVDDIPILWIAAPTTGLLVQPIVGYFSDRTWHPTLGRRRPFFLVGAILASIALVIMPNSPVLWIAAGTLWIMDASINISMEPFRALVADMLPSAQRTMGFAVQTFFIGVGAVVASALPYMLANWFDVANTAPEGQIPDSVKWSFYLGGFAFFTAVFWSVLRTREYPPEEFRRYNGEEGTELVDEGIKQIFTDFVKMPKTMVQLAVVQFFTWFALFCMWLYTTSAVTSHVYGTTDATSELYNEGANWVGVCFAVYNGFSAVLAFLLPRMAKSLGRKRVHLIGLCIGGLSLISIYFIQDPNILLVAMLGVGFAWASILTMPYAILAGSLPPSKMGIYMGIFNFFIVIPQIIASGTLGFISRTFFDNQAIYVLMLGGVAMILAGLLVTFVDDIDDEATEV
ncbi:MFS transporter [Tunicatimonas pelagia]|uniref:MFS transporter n=1 Tax=Tunicatimonas pelagia TaxID=931531 RepID=UPI0026668BB1|nr:MFS transporter [Tunicatimonas pelagia]WKN43884.1 MFS transporter [Tunicatimonas pelagia]